MTNASRRGRCALLAATAAAFAFASAGCGGTVGTKPSSKIRAVDVATNTIDAVSHNDTAVVLVNGAADAVSVPYGTTGPYLFVEAGTSSFAGGFPGALPLIDVGGTNTQVVLPTTTSNGTTTNVQPQPTNYALADGQSYTAYLVGRTDVSNPTQTNLSDLDPRFLKVVVLQDNQPAPPTGSATVRVLVAAPDSGPVDVYANGAGAPQFANVGYSVTATPQSSANVTLPAGTTSIQVNKAGTGTVLVPATNVTLVDGGKYTLVVNEPSAAPVPAVAGTAPTSATYGVVLVQN